MKFICMFAPKRGGTLPIFMVNSGNIHVLWVLDGIHVLLHEFMPHIGTLSTQKLHCAKVGGGKHQSPATQVTHLKLNQPFSFCN